MLKVIIGELLHTHGVSMRTYSDNHDPEGVHSFVDDYVVSFVSWDILLYFHRNADAIETPSSLASRLGRRQRDIEAEISRLVEKGVLTPVNGDTFRHAPAPALARQIEAFSDALNVASSRMTILSQVLGKRRS